MRNWSARNRRVGLAVTPPAIPTEARSRPTTPLTRPKRRPPRPKHPKFTHFHRSGLRFGRFPAQRRSIGGVGRRRRVPECLAAAPVGGRAWPGFETTRRSATRHHWCGGRRKDRRAWLWCPWAAGPGCGARGRCGAWPGFEIDHSEPQARVWRSRGRAAAHGRIKQPGPAAGSDGAQNTSGATSNPAQRTPNNDYYSETSPATTSPRGSRRDRPR